MLEELGKDVNSAIESARDEGKIRVGLEARVEIGTTNTGMKKLLGKYGDELAQLFIVTEVEVDGDGDGKSSPSGKESGSGEGEQFTSLKESTFTNGDKVTISVMKARGEKCVRCWVYLAHEKDGVCPRCEEAVLKMAEAGEVVLDVD